VQQGNAAQIVEKPIGAGNPHGYLPPRTCPTAFAHLQRELASSTAPNRGAKDGMAGSKTQGRQCTGWTWQGGARLTPAPSNGSPHGCWACEESVDRFARKYDNPKHATNPNGLKFRTGVNATRAGPRTHCRILSDRLVHGAVGGPTDGRRAVRRSNLAAPNSKNRVHIFHTGFLGCFLPAGSVVPVP